MASTPTLDAFRPPPLRYDVRPLARLHPNGYLETCGPGFPAPGPALLVLWRPGEDPAFEAARVRLARGAAKGTLRVEGEAPPREAWVVLWSAGSTGAPGEGS